MVLTRLLLPALLPIAAAAQYTTGRIEGTILDPTGAPVSSAALTLTNLENNQARKANSSGAGAFFFAAVNPGRYRLDVAKDSFAAAAAELTIVTSQTLTQNFSLTLASQTATIQVVENAALLNTFQPLRSVTRSTLEIQTLPNAGRNIVNMIALSPGVTPTFNPRGGSLTTLNIAQAGQINANGGRSKATAHQLDSTDANDWEFGGIALSTQPTPYRAERGPSSYDIPHRFILSHVWQLPFYKQQQGLAGRVLGGWNFASINQWQSGIPFTVVSGARLGLADVNMDGDISGPFDNARATCIPGGAPFTFGNRATIPAPAARGINGTANTANFAYVQPLLANHGTCGRNTARMNNLINFDWTLSKNVRLYERVGLEFRSDFFNIFNISFLTAAGDDFRNLSSPLRPNQRRRPQPTHPDVAAPYLVARPLRYSC